MKVWIARSVIAMALVTGFTVNAQAQTVKVPEATPMTISLASSVSAVGVLAHP